MTKHPLILLFVLTCSFRHLAFAQGTFEAILTTVPGLSPPSSGHAVWTLIPPNEDAFQLRIILDTTSLPAPIDTGLLLQPNGSPTRFSLFSFTPGTSTLSLTVEIYNLYPRELEGGVIMQLGSSSPNNGFSAVYSGPVLVSVPELSPSALLLTGAACLFILGCRGGVREPHRVRRSISRLWHSR